MRYEGSVYRPPSEADAYILQATLGCSWNHCTYCNMYRDKPFHVRELSETLADIRETGRQVGPHVEKVFVADGDALILNMTHWQAILSACKQSFPRLKRVSAYATAMNVQEKTLVELNQLREWGLTQLYMGPETGDDITFKHIAKGAHFSDHVAAAQKARAAGMKLSAIFLLGVAGLSRSREHAEESARLITAMDPDFVSMLTLTVVPGTPIATLEERGRFELPSIEEMLQELRTMVDLAQPTNAVFRTNHASNYLPLAGNLPADREQIVASIDQALQGKIGLRPEWTRGL